MFGTAVLPDRGCPVSGQFPGSTRSENVAEDYYSVNRKLFTLGVQ